MVFHLKEWINHNSKLVKYFSQIKIESERLKRFKQNMENHFGVKKVDLETHTLEQIQFNSIQLKVE